jgi:chromosome segregation ATPase
MEDSNRKIDVDHQLMFINNKLGRIEDRLENMEKIQELQAEDLRTHIRRTNILEERILGFDYRHQKTLDALEKTREDLKKDLNDSIEKTNKKQTKLIIPIITIASGLIMLILDIIKHFWS